MRQLPGHRVVESFLGANAGSIPYLDSASFSAASADARTLSADESAYPQTGTGRKAITLTADSYQKLDSVQTVRGSAKFSTGKIDDVKWCNSIDYDMIAPYVLGDDTGGSLDFRKYEFNGGYARKFGKWALGAALAYRAEIAWRDVDPRIKTIVSDLNVSVGASCRISTSRIASVCASLRSYSQNCDLDFFNPMNDINTLPLTGLGTYYKRFAGNTNKNSGHSGLGYHVVGAWASTDGLGLQAAVDFTGMKIQLLLRNFNNITLAYTDTYHTTARLAWGISLADALSLFPMAKGAYLRRLGTENIFGTASGASYDKIGSRSPYLHQTWEMAIEVPLQAQVAGGYAEILPAAGYHSLDESLSSLNRSISVETLWQSIGAGYSRASDKWLWGFNAQFRHSCAISSQCAFPGYDPESALQAMVINSFSILSANTNSISIEANINRAFGKVLAGLAAGYEHTSYSAHGKSSGTHISINLNF